MTYQPYQELLSYSDVERGVDQLLRALLDTSLARIKKTRAANLVKYREEVNQLRQEWLAGPAANLSQGTGYVYWFDVRAQFWSEREVDDELTTLLADPAVLQSVYAQAHALEVRLGVAEKAGVPSASLGSAARAVSLGGSASASSETVKVLKEIIRAVEPTPEAKGKR